VVELFRAVVPARHGEQIASVPRLAALFHNDCAFLAHHAATVGATPLIQLLYPGSAFYGIHMPSVYADCQRATTGGSFPQRLRVPRTPRRHGEVKSSRMKCTYAFCVT
jgi:Centromere/kinetochore Zw10